MAKLVDAQDLRCKVAVSASRETLGVELLKVGESFHLVTPSEAFGVEKTSKERVET